jgi:hypothetical protein
MAAKAQKLRIKRAMRTAGRPRKEGVERFPGGKIKPFETEKDNMSVAIDARRRIHGMQAANDDTVKSQLAGYTLGRIFLDGKITEEQRQAGDEYAEQIARYHRLVGIPFPSARAQSLFSIKGHDGDVTQSMADRARSATNKMMELQRVLLTCVDGPQVKTTIHNCVVMDYDHLRLMPDQQMLWLRRGLSALVKHKGIAKSAALP